VKYSHLILVAILITGAVMLTGCGARIAKDGDTVQVHYTGKLADGTVFDSSVGRQPLSFTLGAGQMIPGFEKTVLGMKVGEKKTVTIPAAEAYGPRDEEEITELSRDKLPSEREPKVGDGLQLTSSETCTTATGIIIKISEDTVTLDFNHPLAGKDLTFDLELVKIE